MPPPLRLLHAGDSALVVEFGDEIELRTNLQVRLLHRALAADTHPGIVETVPTYRSLLVHYDPLVMRRETLETLVLAAAGRLPDELREAVRTVEIPVLYGGDAGPDLCDVAASAGLEPQTVIDIHAGGDYVVFMLGFMPGFPYLGGLAPSIATPRLATPRTVVPAGSVGIAGAQTGIYPNSSPGGWRLVGRTPVRLFDPLQSPPTLLEAGDHVRFVPVLQADFAAIARDVEAGVHRPTVRMGSGSP